jgi:transcriptional regulator with XRE-family HTH domain
MNIIQFNKELCTKEIKCQLIIARKKLKLTQKEIAKELGVSQTVISKIEHERDYGLHKIDFLTIIRLALHYKKPLTYFAPKYLKGRLKRLEERSRSKRYLSKNNTQQYSLEDY